MSTGWIGRIVGLTSTHSLSTSHRWLPFGDPSRARRLLKLAAWLGGIVLAIVVLDLLGVDVGGWLSSLWDTMTEIPAGYLVVG